MRLIASVFCECAKKDICMYTSNENINCYNFAESNWAASINIFNVGIFYIGTFMSMVFCHSMIKTWDYVNILIV